MLGRVHVYTFTRQTPWLIAGSQSGSRYVGLRLDLLTWLLV